MVCLGLPMRVCVQIKNHQGFSSICGFVNLGVPRSFFFAGTMLMKLKPRFKSETGTTVELKRAEIWHTWVEKKTPIRHQEGSRGRSGVSRGGRRGRGRPSGDPRGEKRGPSAAIRRGTGQGKSRSRLDENVISNSEEKTTFSLWRKYDISKNLRNSALA